jgi:branched-subunit amino acid aminotransferase/4-amino-4-deoxychorismate lyase
MRTMDRHSIVELTMHMKRMTNSIAHMSLGASSPAEETKIKEAMVSFRDLKQFEPKLLPMLIKGLQTYYDQVDQTTCSDHPFEAKVSLMVTWSHEVI